MGNETQELLPCPFERGQVWENPDDKLMLVKDVQTYPSGDFRVTYVTEDREIGRFYSHEKDIIDNITQWNTRTHISIPRSDLEEMKGSPTAVCIAEYTKGYEDGHNALITKLLKEY